MNVHESLVFMYFKGDYALVFNYPDAETLAKAFLRRRLDCSDEERQMIWPEYYKEAQRSMDEYYNRYGHRFKYLTHPNDYRRLRSKNELPQMSDIPRDILLAALDKDEEEPADV